MYKSLNLALCEGRHSIPQATDGTIFPHEITDMTNTPALERTAYEGIFYACMVHGGGLLRYEPKLEDITDIPFVFEQGMSINLYVTGLTVALIAALNVCHTCGIKVTLWHYNRETGDYYPQEVK